MLQQGLLTQVLEVLHLGEIAYIVTGFLVSGIQGEPSTTHVIYFAPISVVIKCDVRTPWQST